MKSIILLIALIMTACTNYSDSNGNTDLVVTPINSQFQSYVASFTTEAAANGYDVSKFSQVKLGIDFGTPDGSTTIGYCTTNKRQSQVIINPIYWNSTSFTDVDRKALIYHELGHCLLFKGHQAETFRIQFTNSDGIFEYKNTAVSLMSPTLVTMTFQSNELSYLGQVLMPNYYIPEIFKAIGTDMGLTGTAGANAVTDPNANIVGSDYNLIRK